MLGQQTFFYYSDFFYYSASILLNKLNFGHSKLFTISTLHRNNIIFVICFFENWEYHIFPVLLGSWEVHRYHWFQNRSIKKVKIVTDTYPYINSALLYRFPFLHKYVYVIVMQCILHI